MDKAIAGIYSKLLSEYGPQGWWPIRGKYHKGDYSYPRSEIERFEICIGAILAQNTSWSNAAMAIENLHKIKAINPKGLLSVPSSKLKSAIAPSRYFNQKSKKVITFSKFFLKNRGRIPDREELLGIWGIGPETADSILLYGYSQPSFVVDAYTRRIFSRLGIIDFEADYSHIRNLFMENLEPDFEMFSEYHALIVEHGKRYYQRKPYGEKDPLLRGLRKHQKP